MTKEQWDRRDERGDPVPKNTKKAHVPPEVSAYFARLNKNKGFCAWSKAKRSAMSKLNSKRGWATRRKRYGWQGYRVRAAKKTPSQIAESIMVNNPDLIDHPVWRES